jgi:hypothetical protein
LRAAQGEHDSARIVWARGVLEGASEEEAAMDATIDGLESETGLLIESALEGVRAVARLDDDPVLPPLPVAPPRRNPVPPPCGELPRPRAPASLGSQMPTVKVRPQKAARGVRWPIVCCAFVASVAGGAALMASPLGARPSVRHAVIVSRSETVRALHVVTAFALRLKEVRS